MSTTEGPKGAWNSFIGQLDEGEIGGRCLSLQIICIINWLLALGSLGGFIGWQTLINFLLACIWTYFGTHGSWPTVRSAKELWYFMVVQFISIVFGAVIFVLTLLGLFTDGAYFNLSLLVSIFINLAILWLAYLIRFELEGGKSPAFFSWPTKDDVKSAAKAPEKA